MNSGNKTNSITQPISDASKAEVKNENYAGNFPLSELPVKHEIPKQKSKIAYLLIILLVVIVLGSFGYWVYKNRQFSPKPQSTSEKLVMMPVETVDPTANWKTYKHNMYTLKYPESFFASTGQFDTSDTSITYIYSDEGSPFNGPHMVIIIDPDNNPDSLNSLANTNYQANISHKGLPGKSISVPMKAIFASYDSIEYLIANKGFISPREEYIGYDSVYNVIWVNAVKNNFLIYYTITQETEDILSTFKFTQ